MPDREKVIKGLEVCIDREPGEYSCYKCPYEIDANDCEINLSKDTLALLKEHEPVKQKVSEWLEDSDPGQEYGTTWACRKCMHSIHKPYIWNPYDSGYKYCPHCGAMMER